MNAYNIHINLLEHISLSLDKMVSALSFCSSSQTSNVNAMVVPVW